MKSKTRRLIARVKADSRSHASAGRLGISAMTRKERAKLLKRQPHWARKHNYPR
jgi:hypothetical protein